MENTIKHLVISGGGTYGLTAYGILRETNKSNFWKIENIKSCHGTSVGTIVSLLILLKYDWKVMDDYLIKRPWNKAFKYDLKQCLNTFDKCGAFEKNDFTKAFESLFAGADININITLKDFYELTKVEFYLYCAEINDFELECFSYKSHPEVKVLDAIYASCSLPIVFQPLIIENKAYIDGGLFLNYPIKNCLETMEAKNDEIFGIFKSLGDENKKYLQTDSNMYDYFSIILKNMVKHMNKDSYIEECKYQIQVFRGHSSIDELTNFLSSEKYRIDMIEEGVEYSKKFLESLEN